ncbi:MAG: ECF transporter S component [Lachnospiraceae bacterium]|nr:ECF transporter S component [Lachnospiraceae bacterium]
MKKNSALLNLVLSAMFLAIGLILPFFTGQVPQVGKMLLPMHIPVILCGLICGWPYGLTVGLILPLLRSFLFSAPILYPTAVAMAFELAAYGGVVGFLYGKSRWKCIVSLYRSMLLAMVAGRVVWGIAMVILLGISGGTFTISAFLAGAFLNAIPGIVIQLILIPALMVILNRTRMVQFSEKKASCTSAGQKNGQ